MKGWLSTLLKGQSWMGQARSSPLRAGGSISCRANGNPSLKSFFLLRGLQETLQEVIFMAWNCGCNVAGSRPTWSERRWILLCAFVICLDSFLSLHNYEGLIGKPTLGKVYNIHLIQKRQFRSYGQMVSHSPLGPVAGQKLFLKHQAFRILLYFISQSREKCVLI